MCLKEEIALIYDLRYLTGRKKNHPVINLSIRRGALSEWCFCFQGNYFLVSDQSPKVDVLQTLAEFKAANFHKAHGKAPVFASGQPTVDGLKRIMRKFHEDGYQVRALD